MKLIPFAALSLAACGGAPDDIERICDAMTECGVIRGDDTDRCISELDVATPDSASRAAAECAACLDEMTCGQVSQGSCAATCEPLFDSINRVAGTVSGACTSSGSANYASESLGGNLLLQLDCDPPIHIVPGPYFDTVGTTKACGRFESLDGEKNCPQAVGNVTIQDRGGRRWVVGSCGCSGMSVSFELPLHLEL